MTSNTTTNKTQRLLSLDILRGFDLFLLVFLQPVLWGLLPKLEYPWLQPVITQLSHENWIGFRCWDLVMPLFLFITGVAMPFSFAKLSSSAAKEVYLKMFKRVIILFLLGMIVQGNLLGLNPNVIYFYSNTLQAIAIGYFITGAILFHFQLKGQLVALFLLLVIYWIPMTFLGDFTPQGNFAEKIDQLVLGRFRDGVYWTEDGLWHFSPHYHYTWIWSSLTFGATVLLGAFAGQVIRSGITQPRIVVQRLLYIGAGLTLCGLLFSFQMPIIKPIWTSSMTLFSGGISFLLLALFYYWIDYKKHTRGLLWLTYYGKNSIVAYVLGTCVSFRSIATSLSHGLQPYMGQYYTVWITFLNFLILFLILRWLAKNNYFLKV
ncbi:MAG: acyltransferase family protein [Marinifilaceae bacterium]